MAKSSPPDKKTIEEFRAQYRLMLLERLVLKNALLEPAIHRHLSIEQSAEELKDWLQRNADLAVSAFGGALRDPGMTALYSDEAKEVAEEMKKEVDLLAKDIDDKLAKIRA